MDGNSGITKRPVNILLQDPLTEVTRRERRMLLAASLLALTVVHAGIVPEKISAIGVEFSKVDQRYILLLLGLVILYFMVGFFTYALSDFFAWRWTLLQALAEIKAKRALAAEDQRLNELEKFAALTESASQTESASPWTTFIPKSGDFELLREKFLTDTATPTLRLTRVVSIVRAVFDFLLPPLVGGYGIYATFKQAAILMAK